MSYSDDEVKIDEIDELEESDLDGDLSDSLLLDEELILADDIIEEDEELEAFAGIDGAEY